MAAGDAAVAAKLASVGVAAIQPAAGLAVLEQASAIAGGTAVMMAAAVVWERLLLGGGRQHQHFYAQMAGEAARAPSPAVADAVATVAVVPGGGKRHKQPLQRAVAFPPPTAAPTAALVQERGAAILARVLGREAAPDEALMAAGLDSLGAVELRKELSAAFTVELSATAVFDYPSLAALAAHVVSLLPPPAAPAVAAAREPTRQALAGQHLAIVTAQVEAAVAHVLGGASVAADTPLMAAGLDSLGAVELRKELSSVFAVELPATAVFDYPTVAALAGWLAALVPARGTSSASRSATSEDGEQQLPNAQPPAPAMPQALGPHNKRAPTLTRQGYWTSPSMRRLEQMSDAQLARVPRFVVGCDGVGEIAFLYPGARGERRGRAVRLGEAWPVGVECCADSAAHLIPTHCPQSTC